MCFMSLDQYVHICISMSCGRVNITKMMPRYIEWTFEAWYQSELPFTPSLAPWVTRQASKLKNPVRSTIYVRLLNHLKLLEKHKSSYHLSYHLNTSFHPYSTNHHISMYIEFKYMCNEQVIWLMHNQMQQLVYELAPPSCVHKKFNWSLFQLALVSLPLCHQWP